MELKKGELSKEAERFELKDIEITEAGSEPARDTNRTHQCD